MFSAMLIESSRSVPTIGTKPIQCCSSPSRASAVRVGIMSREYGIWALAAVVARTATRQANAISTSHGPFLSGAYVNGVRQEYPSYFPSRHLPVGQAGVALELWEFDGRHRLLVKVHSGSGAIVSGGVSRGSGWSSVSGWSGGGDVDGEGAGGEAGGAGVGDPGVRLAAAGAEADAAAQASAARRGGWRLRGWRRRRRRPGWRARRCPGSSRPGASASGSRP